MCLAQGEGRSNRDKAEFRATLPNINLLYLGSAVLVLMFDITCAWPGLTRPRRSCDSAPHTNTALTHARRASHTWSTT